MPGTLVNGAQLCARAMKQQGVEYCFGIVGYPIVELGLRIQEEGIKYYHCRNEQAASYAAAAVGYLTGRPGAVIGVSGPGAIHAFAGAANAWSNCWPCLVIGGSSESHQTGMGGFQECPQVPMAAPVCKLARMVDSAQRIPFHVEQAVRTSITGRPGAVYLDFPGDILRNKVAADDVPFPPRCPDPPRPVAAPAAIQDAVSLLKQAKRPLVIVGKGAAYARAEREVAQLLSTTNMPFLPTPMGKGVVSDADDRCVGAARSAALAGADVVVLVGARLNWILHFGQPPRWAADVKIIQIDICPEEIHQGLPTAVPLVGDAAAVCGQLGEAAAAAGLRVDGGGDWWQTLRAKVRANSETNEKLAAVRSTPMNYYYPLQQINDRLPRDCVVVGEGDQTMNIGRTVLQNHLPRRRLDAGTFGTMGVGIPQILAAAATHPGKKVVGVLGDSAFGFSMAEFETLTRYGIDAAVIVINNGGISRGSSAKYDDPLQVPAQFLAQGIRYEKLAEAFGAPGYLAETPEQLERALDVAFSAKGPVLINCVIEASAASKPQTHKSWLTLGKGKKSSL
eukprot:TRINITY_DN26586_c0_g1_i1.p1 TRINITY_DN26586_c0_g1~~TRINITY_DN26586_c0_g1_i1.p1  ORF type:complete len:586 (+),score=182.88 TRINITY_DN26586_c0_g1_i1:68-1759(+)